MGRETFPWQDRNLSGIHILQCEYHHAGILPFISAPQLFIFVFDCLKIIPGNFVFDRPTSRSDQHFDDLRRRESNQDLSL
jgi:hypothetical protein